MPDRRFTFRADSATAEALDAYCEANERKPSQALRLALKRFIPDEYFQPARRVKRKLAKAQA